MDGYMSYQSGRGNESTTNNDSFKNLTHTISSNIEKISQNVSSMSKMVNQLQTSLDSNELRTQLRNIQNYTQKITEDTSKLLMELMKVPLQPGQTEAKLTKSRLSDEFMSTLNQYQLVQKQAALKTKEEVRKTKSQNYDIKGAFNPNRNAGPMNEETLINMDETARHQEQITLQAERELQELQQNERDMLNIESNISAVNDIFKELGQIITEQGVVVDSIESNIEQTANNVQAGSVQLREAATYQNKARRKKFILLGVLAIIVIIILIIIFHRS